MFELNKRNITRIFLGVAGCLFLYWLLHDADRVKIITNKVSGMLAPFIFGGVLAFILNVPVRSLENKLLRKIQNLTFRRTMAVSLTFLGLMLIVLLVVWLLVPQLADTVTALGPALTRFVEKAEKVILDFLHSNPKLMEMLNISPELESLNWGSLVSGSLSGLGNLGTSFLGSAFSTIGKVFSGAFDACIALVFCVYCLFHKENLARQGRKILYAYFKEKTADNIIRILRLTNGAFSNFLSGQCIEVCILGGMFAISMAIFRMPYIPLISVVIALTAFIPIVGAWTGCILGTFLIFVKDPTLAVWFVVLFLVIQQIETNLIYPRVVGTSVGLSGMWVLVAVAIGGELLGIIGMFLMIPIASVLHTLLRETINKKLQNSHVDAEKLKPQPPERKIKNLKKNKKTLTVSDEDEE